MKILSHYVVGVLGVGRESQMDYKIVITRDSPGFFFYLGEKRSTIAKFCIYCGSKLDLNYSYIIEKLIKAELLDENFEKVCCQCFHTRKHCGSIICSHSNSKNPIIIKSRERKNCLGHLCYNLSFQEKECFDIVCMECGKLHKTIKMSDL